MCTFLAPAETPVWPLQQGLAQHVQTVWHCMLRLSCAWMIWLVVRPQAARPQAHALPVQPGFSNCTVNAERQGMCLTFRLGAPGAHAMLVSGPLIPKGLPLTVWLWAGFTSQALE